MPKRYTVPLRCVNCGINMAHGVACTELSPSAISILQQWIPSYDFKESTLCHECCGLLRGLEWGQGGLEGGQGGPPARALGHTHVCRDCGRSLLRRRTFHKPVFDGDAPNIYEHLEMLCASCYLRRERAAKKAATSDDNTAQFDEEPEEQIADEPEEQIADKPEEQTVPAYELRHRNTTQAEKKTAEASHLALSNYRRLRGGAGAGAGCAAAGCGGRGARLSLARRRHSLRTCRLYLPAGARLCPAHRPITDLTPLLRLSSDFTGEQVADMLFLMKPFPPPLNADDVESMDGCLRRIWLGVTWEEFLASRQADPSKSQRTLAIRLCAQHSGECPAVLASLFQLPQGEIDQALRCDAAEDSGEIETMATMTTE